MLIVILGTSSTNSDYNGGCDYAFIKLTPELARKALERVDQLKRFLEEDGQLHEMTFWDGNVKFLSYSEFIEELASEEGGPCEEALRHQGFAVVQDVDNLFEGVEDELVRAVDCLWMVVSKDAVYWKAIARHGDIYISSREIPRELLERAAHLGHVWE